MSQDCVVYRCSRQNEMYLYLRADLAPEALPEALRSMTGRLTEVMRLTLDGARKLARVDPLKVVQKLEADGYYLQMPPNGQMYGHTYEGD